MDSLVHKTSELKNHKKKGLLYDELIVKKNLERTNLWMSKNDYESKTFNRQNPERPIIKVDPDVIKNIFETK
jgi:hypothetical protein